MKSKLQYFGLMTGATILGAVGIYFFKFTNNFTFGGVTGLAVLIAKVTPMTASDFSFIANMVLLVIGLFVLGKEFAIKTAYSSILLSVSLSLLDRFYPMAHPFTDQPMLELCFAIALPAISSAILFNIGASSGGTDIIAMIMKKYTSFDIGKALLLSDLLFTIIACFIFGIQTGLFSLLGLFIRSFMIDGIIESLNLRKYFTVICKNPDPICEYIKANLHRGATIVPATGAFSGSNKHVILTVVNRRQAVKLRNYIHQNAPDAFMVISDTSQIIGKGFMSM